MNKDEAMANTTKVSGYDKIYSNVKCDSHMKSLSIEVKALDLGLSQFI